MNNKPHNPDSGDDDRLVSTTYRELANESTPDALDRSVLRKAAAAARPGYLRSMFRMRPMAWVAMAGLCLAVVLRITQLPQPEEAVIETDAVFPATVQAPERSRPTEKQRTNPPAPALQAGYASERALLNVQNPGCDEESTATPVTWLECIATLEQAGQSDAASRQRERMKQAFPEFDQR